MTVYPFIREWYQPLPWDQWERQHDDGDDGRVDRGVSVILQG